MDADKRQRLEAKGVVFMTVEEFFGLDDGDKEEIERRLATDKPRRLKPPEWHHEDFATTAAVWFETPFGRFNVQGQPGLGGFMCYLPDPLHNRQFKWGEDDLHSYATLEEGMRKAESLYRQGWLEMTEGVDDAS
jgi:hypothetical protein